MMKPGFGIMLVAIAGALVVLGGCVSPPDWQTEQEAAEEKVGVLESEVEALEAEVKAKEMAIKGRRGCCAGSQEDGHGG